MADAQTFLQIPHRSIGAQSLENTGPTTHTFCVCLCFCCLFLLRWDGDGCRAKHERGLQIIRTTRTVSIVRHSSQLFLLFGKLLIGARDSIVVLNCLMHVPCKTSESQLHFSKW